MASLMSGGNLKIDIRDTRLTSKVDAIIDHARGTGSMLEAMSHFGMSRKFPYPLTGTHERLTIIYTDLEPDDILACVQIVAWKAELNQLGQSPVFVFCVDLARKDGGKILEKKQLMAFLALGGVDWSVLTFEGDTGESKFKDGSVHPRTNALSSARDAELDVICNKIAGFGGTHVDFYVLAPGHGNIGAILARLGKRSQLPLKHEWRISMYSGSFNTIGMEEADLLALEEIMKSSDLPLVDMSKFPFFGGTEHLEITDSLATFSLPDFVPQLLEHDPLFAASWKSFNDEFNQGLIHPDNDAVFKGSELDSEESRRFAALKQMFLSEGVQAYALALMSDDGLWSKVVSYKKSTVATFAAGACDSPLCDQLVFFYDWLSKEQPSMLVATPQGKWILDPMTGYTKIDAAAPGGIRAIQPSLKNPRDVESIETLRKVAHDYIFRHWSSLQERAPCKRSHQTHE